MDLVLAGLQWTSCLVYLDDVIILGQNFADHMQKLDAVFQRIREAGVNEIETPEVFIPAGKSVLPRPYRIS